MPDLDELEAKARAAKDGLTIQAIETARAQLERACDPDTILHLIERVRAGEALANRLQLHEMTVNGSSVCGLFDDRDSALLARWESLAHSPQEPEHVHVRSVDRGNGEGHFCAICGEVLSGHSPQEAG